MSEHGEGADASAVGLSVAVVEDVPEQVEIGGHGG